MSAFFSKAAVHKHGFRLSPNVCFRPEAAVPEIGRNLQVASRIRFGGRLGEEVKAH